MKHFAFICCLLLSVTAIASITTEWEDYSNPSIRSSNFERTFTKLPLAGAPKDTGKLWASDYWSRKKGSINLRWNSRNPVGFDLVSPTLVEAQTMTLDQLATLAPSEKLDLLNGDFDYSIKKEVDKNADKGAPLWHGICNGWSPAAMNHVEPTPKTLTSVNGIQVPFGSSDIKALLSWYYAYHHEVDSTRQMGKRCMLGFGPGCDQDLNAGAFHIVLTNTVGIQQESIIMDVERGRQVWNHAVNDYKSVVVQDNLAPKNSAKGTVKRIRVQTDMQYVSAIKANSWYPTNGTADHINAVKHYEYMLDIDAYGAIIGGEWLSSARPDFLWSMPKATSFEGRYSRLSELLND